LRRGRRPTICLSEHGKARRSPRTCTRSIQEGGVLDLGGVFGDRDAGDPIEYDQLRLILADAAVVEIEFFNRGITLFLTDDETHRRIHRVLCQLDRLD